MDFLRSVMIRDEEVRPMAADELAVDHQPESYLILKALERSATLHDLELLAIVSLSDRVMPMAERTCLALAFELAELSASVPPTDI
jgi:hypothetical protein